MAEASDTTEAKTPATAEAKPPAKLTWDEFNGLVKRAESGDRKALPRLRLHIRTTDPIESVFSTAHLRHAKTKGSGSRSSCLTMV
jgi:hypothetical protein